MNSGCGPWVTTGLSISWYLSAASSAPRVERGRVQEKWAESSFTGPQTDDWVGWNLNGPSKVELMDDILKAQMADPAMLFLWSGMEADDKVDDGVGEMDD